MAKSSSFAGELIHFNPIRLRVNGTGILRTSLWSLDNVKSSILAPLSMLNATDREPVILSNFTQQRAQYEIKTTAIDEVFVISKITIFIRPVATEYPR